MQGDLEIKKVNLLENISELINSIVKHDKVNNLNKDMFDLASFNKLAKKPKFKSSAANIINTYKDLVDLHGEFKRIVTKFNNMNGYKYLSPSIKKYIETYIYNNEYKIRIVEKYRHIFMRIENMPEIISHLDNPRKVNFIKFIPSVLPMFSRLKKVPNLDFELFSTDFLDNKPFSRDE